MRVAFHAAELPPSLRRDCSILRTPFEPNTREASTMMTSGITALPRLMAIGQPRGRSVISGRRSDWRAVMYISLR